MRTLPPILVLVATLTGLALLPLTVRGEERAPEPAGSALPWSNTNDVEVYEMVTDDADSNRAFYRAIGFEFVPEESVGMNESVYSAGYCIRLAQRYHLDGKQARFLGLLYVAQHAIAPACYTLQPFTLDLATRRCNLMKRPVLHNDPATRRLVCGPRRPESAEGSG